MVPRLSLVTLGVSDIARATRFYRDLGFTVLEGSNANVTFLDAGGTLLGLFGRAELAHDAMVEDGPHGFGGVTLAWNVVGEEEVNVAIAHALALGAKLTKAPAKTFWGGYSGYFADADGHLWEVAHNPFWPMDEEGRIRLSPADGRPEPL